MSFKERIKISFLVIFLGLYMLLICGPIEVYSQNIIDFEFILSDFIYFFIIGTIVGTLVITMVLSIFPSKVYKYILSFVLTLIILSYVQYLFFNNGISTTDGTLINWLERKNSSIIYTTIYVICFVIIYALILKQKNLWNKIVIYISIGLLIVNTAALIANIINIKNTNKTIAYCQLSADNQFNVAKNNNIIIIVLDGVGNQTFENYCDNYPELASCVKDFTYYNNYDSLYMPTMPSVTHILTGYTPNSEINRYQWSTEAWESEKCKNFFDTIHAYNYKFNIYIGSQGYVFCNVNALYGKIDNIKKADAKTNYKLMVPMMVKYSMYRYAPYALKERFEVNPEFYRGCVEYSINDRCIDNNEEFYLKLAESKLQLNADLDNAIIIEHINGMHRHSDENLSNDEYFISSMKVVDEYISQLKELGKYDDSTIIICSDHGSHTDDMDRQGIFLIKSKGENHKTIKINSAPICSDDFQATIIDIIGCDYSKFGTRITDWNENDRRERTTFITSNDLPSGLWGYTYYTDRYELMETMKDGFDVECPGVW